MAGVVDLRQRVDVDVHLAVLAEWVLARQVAVADQAVEPVEGVAVEVLLAHALRVDPLGLVLELGRVHNSRHSCEGNTVTITITIIVIITIIIIIIIIIIIRGRTTIILITIIIITITVTVTVTIIIITIIIIIIIIIIITWESYFLSWAVYYKVGL